MPITTFLKEKIRDPRVKGAPFAEEMTENFNISFASGSSTKNFEIQFDLAPQDEIVLSFLTFLTNVSDLTFIFGTEQTYNNLKNTQQTFTMSITYNGQRRFDITYINNTGNVVAETIAATYTPEDYKYIETMYMRYDTSETDAQLSIPSIYIHGNLADSASVTATNLANNAVTTAKLAGQSVTTEKIANNNITWEKLKCELTNVTTPTGQPQRMKWRFIS